VFEQQPMLLIPGVLARGKSRDFLPPCRVFDDGRLDEIAFALPPAGNRGVEEGPHNGFRPWSNQTKNAAVVPDHGARRIAKRDARRRG
jgi:hypothetical protein